MSRISTLNVGIEGFTHVSLEHVESDFPQRFQLLPDGQAIATHLEKLYDCLLYTSPSPRDLDLSRMPSSA